MLCNIRTLCATARVSRCLYVLLRRMAFTRESESASCGFLYVNFVWWSDCCASASISNPIPIQSDPIEYEFQSFHWRCSCQLVGDMRFWSKIDAWLSASLVETKEQHWDVFKLHPFSDTYSFTLWVLAQDGSSYKVIKLHWKCDQW